MKFLPIAVALTALTSAASGAVSLPSKFKAGTLSRRDPHRMLRKRALSSGSRQGRMEFVSLQHAIVGSLPIEKRERRVRKPRKASKAKKAVQKRDTTVFEDCEEDDSSSSPQTNSTSDSEDDCDDEASSSSTTSDSSSSSSSSSSAASTASASSSNSYSSSGSSNSGSSGTDSNSGGDDNSSSDSASYSSSSGSSSNAKTVTSASVSTSGGTGQVYTGGIATWFTQNGVAGACGTVHQDSDSVVALPTSMYNGGALCGKQIIVTDVDTGKTATATVADECPTCPIASSLDCSVGLFTQFASEDQGTFNVKWQLAS